MSLFIALLILALQIFCGLLSIWICLCAHVVRTDPAETLEDRKRYGRGILIFGIVVFFLGISFPWMLH